MIDVIVQLERTEGKRGIAAIARASDLVETWQLHNRRRATKHCAALAFA